MKICVSNALKIELIDLFKKYCLNIRVPREQSL